MIHCFYHSADLDGHCSGAIVKYRFPDAVMHPINYGQEFPWEEIHTADIIYMVDFCLQPDEQMMKLHDLAVDLNAELHWIDHHKSQEHLTNKMLHWQGYFNTSKAACELTWEYLFPDRPVPLVVKLLSLYDSWTYQGHELEDMVLPFQLRMRMEDLNPLAFEIVSEKWIDLFEEDLLWIPHEHCTRSVDYIIEEGKLLLRYDEEQKRRYVQTYGFETTLFTPKYLENPFNKGAQALKAIAVNLGHTNSKVFDSVWRRECPVCKGGKITKFTALMVEVPCKECHDLGYIEPYDLMITFCRRSDKKWNVSLYSTKPEIDCGAIASSFGGGGHKGAAGFQCTELPFDY